jgi:hypothetical protein
MTSIGSPHHMAHLSPSPGQLDDRTPNTHRRMTSSTGGGRAWSEEEVMPGIGLINIQLIRLKGKLSY